MLVSCIMPTRGRKEFALRALDCFRAQTWPEKELVVIDDLDMPSFRYLIMDGVKHYEVTHRLSVGAKRNLACSRANGEIIAHFDDDDVSSPGRIADQVERILATGADVTGYNVMTFKDEAGRKWKYTGKPNYALGTSLMYTRAFWQRNPFPDQYVGEDGVFVGKATRLVAVDAGDLMYATIHANNTSPRPCSGSMWKPL